MLHGAPFGSMIRTGIFRQASQVTGSSFARQFHAFSQILRNSGAVSELIKSSKIQTHLQSSILGNLGMKLGLLRLAENVPLPCTLSFRSFVHSGEQTKAEAENNFRSTDHESGNGVNGQPPLEFGDGRNLRSVGFNQVLNRDGRIRVNTRPPLENEEGRTPTSYVQGLLRESGVNGRPTLHQPAMDDMQGIFQGRGNDPMGFYNHAPLESNADIVHIKLMRNNSYVTLTDHKGNRKKSVSAGQVAAKGDKPGRYSGESAAEYMGRVVKQLKIRSVVVKVSGFTFFRRKKDMLFWPSKTGILIHEEM